MASNSPRPNTIEPTGLNTGQIIAVWRAVFEDLSGRNKHGQEHALLKPHSCGNSSSPAIIWAPGPCAVTLETGGYDKTARNFLAAVHLTAAVIWLN